MISKYTFENPEFFWLFILLPILIFWGYWSRKKTRPSLRISHIPKGDGITSDPISKIYALPYVLKLVAFCLLIIALARPRTSSQSTEVKKNKGIDIVMAIDVSASMLAKDLKPNRLEALKKVAAEFIQGRVSDRVGLVVYAAESYTKTPITSDKEIVLSTLKQVFYDQNLQNGTAIGMGLATAVNRLKDSKAKSKVIILLTDGSNNSGFIDPSIATELANEYNIKVYTIGVGTNGLAMSPVALYSNGEFKYAKVKVEIDEKLLREIAEATSGKYFRATDNKKLAQIYAEIDTLEKTDIEEIKYTKFQEHYRFFGVLAFIFIAVAYFLKQTLFKSFI